MYAWFYVLGARTTIFFTKAYLNTITMFDLHAEGLPRDSVILDLNVSPQGMFCTEMSGNNRRQGSQQGASLQLYGFNVHGHTIQCEEAEVSVAVTWVRKSEDDAAWKNLVAAFDAHANRNYDAAVIPANVAVEAKLYRFIQKGLHGIASKERTEDFLQSAATYSHQLNILLPLLVRHAGLPPFDPLIRGFLNALRDARNDVAHRGHARVPLTDNRAAELLTAALFGFRYINFLEGKTAQ